MIPSFWRGKRVFITGHTGFKGSWLGLWLQSLGAKLGGLALEPPTTPNLFTEARIGEGMTSAIADVRDYQSVCQAVAQFRPEIVFHMAAQALVRASYGDPVATYATNVMGTVHVLEAVRNAGSVQALVNVTSDKCYENKEWVWGYREADPMGGHDPYSSSKGCSELVTSAYRRSFLQKNGIAAASARAGNVIGGGDWAHDRLVPDVLRAFEAARPAIIRNPDSVRPWQHVLEPLSGYLTLAERLCGDDGQSYAEGWNFGPLDEDSRPVRWIVERLAEGWGDGARWQSDSGEHPHEASHLKLDSSKSRGRLGWSPRWELAIALGHTAAWHKARREKADVRSLCLQQLAAYVDSPTPRRA